LVSKNPRYPKRKKTTGKGRGVYQETPERGEAGLVGGPEYNYGRDIFTPDHFLQLQKHMSILTHPTRNPTHKAAHHPYPPPPDEKAYSPSVKL
jgi:hypothetical protein